VSRKLTHLSLFTGIGGIDLAAEWAGFETAGQCEWADYPTRVLEKHWPNVPRWRDIRTLTGDDFYARTGMRTVDLVSGGFPCQPFSSAGKRRGKEDDRYLWPEMCRVIEELKPNWVIGENVANAVRMVADEIMHDLEAIHYTGGIFIVPAYSAGAWYKGDRAFIVAASNNGSAAVRRNTQFPANDDALLSGRNHRRRTPEPDPGKRWQEQSRPYGVADGVPDRVDRLTCTGNAVNPYQVYPILRAIAEIEKGIPAIRPCAVAENDWRKQNED
jgi:DNA (cytosine-5)-methyltransferase 1